MIYKLEREATAQIIIRQLPRLWNSLNHLVIQLRKTTRNYTTTELIDIRNKFTNNYSLMNNFNISNGVWFSSRYPEFATVLGDTIVSMQTINSIIVSGLQSNYWDAELDKAVVMDISQSHRNTLANNIETELE